LSSTINNKAKNKKGAEMDHLEKNRFIQLILKKVLADVCDSNRATRTGNIR